MTARRTTWTRAYGASGWHLGVMLASFVVVTYVVVTLGPTALWDPEVWWQSVAVWFVGAVILHDLVLFPAYAVADRLILRKLESAGGVGEAGRAVPLINFVRVPTLVAGLSFLLFFPGILQQGSESFTAATGLTQEPFLERWLFLVTGSYVLSSLLYAAAVLRTRRRT